MKIANFGLTAVVAVAVMAVAMVRQAQAENIINCQFAEYLYRLERILIRPVEAGSGMSLEHSWGCGWQRLSQPGVERFAQAKKPQDLPDDLW